jgi:hypothetical protein
MTTTQNNSVSAKQILNNPSIIKAKPNLKTKTAAAVARQTYATQFNAKYKTKNDTYVTIEDRFNDMLAAMPGLKKQLAQIGKEIRKRYNYTNFSDMSVDMVGLGTGPTEKLEDLVINEIIQREPVGSWVFKLEAAFDPFYVNPIRIYHAQIKSSEIKSATVPNDPDKQVDARVVWDGQHTALMLLAIAIYGFGLSMKEALACSVPVAVYPGIDLGKIRNRFVSFNNGQMSLPLDKFDIYMQYVYAVRHNGSTHPDHVRMEQIQCVLEDHGMFFTHEKFNDHTKPGALTRATEIFPATGKLDKFSVNTIKNVCSYHALTNPNKHVEPLEMDNMCHIFRACEEQGILVDDEYISQFAIALHKATGNTWAKGQKSKKSKHTKVLRAYNSWRNRQPNSEAFATRCNQTLVAPTWICQAVKQHGFPYGVPSFPFALTFNFTEQELK